MTATAKNAALFLAVPNLNNGVAQFIHPSGTGLGVVQYARPQRTVQRVAPNGAIVRIPTGIYTPTIQFALRQTTTTALILGGFTASAQRATAFWRPLGVRGTAEHVLTGILRMSLTLAEQRTVLLSINASAYLLRSVADDLESPPEVPDDHAAWIADARPSLDLDALLAALPDAGQDEPEPEAKAKAKAKS